jgi:predicted RNA-binding protein with PIN domain
MAEKKKGESQMAEKKKVFGEGVLKTSARELSVFVDEEGNSWICDKEAAKNIDPNKPFAEQGMERCQIMPFDHGG